nr:immunoglobulin heavy chain junction region [Macaca mulatta]MPN69260.1 immunoglobulin heavy chain junction region [Macaca mulatta]MPN69283.1 immunoglobulin heavy chain junction region [Macaca mulatta]MPN69300.1 immunoglobulin heavy chain junction region [Macaca mulatta]MPN69302.1 immunoglobulin heavy chain junction region [Macaca mulatta]
CARSGHYSSWSIWYFDLW